MPGLDELVQKLIDAEEEEVSQEPVQDESEQVESVETPDALKKAESEYDLDSEVDAALEITKDEEFAALSAESHKLGRKAKEIVQRGMDDEAQKLYSNATRALGRSRNEIGELRKKLAELEKAQNQSVALKTDSKVLKELEETAQTDTSKLDPYNPDDLRVIMRVEQAKLRLAENEEYQGRIQQKEEEEERDAFVRANPEILQPEYKKAMVEVYKKYPEISLEDGYRLAQGMLLERDKQIEVAKRKGDAATLRKLGAGSMIQKISQSRPKNWDRMTAMEKLEWAETTGWKPNYRDV